MNTTQLECYIQVALCMSGDSRSSKALHILGALRVLVVLLLALAIAGCSAGESREQSESQVVAAERTPESSPTPSGEYLVGDAEHFCFYYRNDTPGVGGTSGLYCADSGLEEAKGIYIGSQCNTPLCLNDGIVYCSDVGAGVTAIDLKTDELRIVAGGEGPASGSPRAIYEDPDAASRDNTYLLFTDANNKLHMEPLDGGDDFTSEPLDWVDGSVNNVVVGNGVVYFDGRDAGDDVLCVCDMSKSKTSVITSSEYSDGFNGFTAIGTDTYYLMRADSESADGDEPETSFFMHRDSGGHLKDDIEVRDVLGENVFSYDGFLFYTRLVSHQADDEDAKTTKVARPCYYDPETGTETVVEHDAYGDADIYMIGVANGYLYLSLIERPDPYTDSYYDDSAQTHILFDRIDGSADPIDVDALTAAAKITEQSVAWDEADHKALEEEGKERRQAEEEAKKNEPYGPGTSKLYLKASDDRSACFRLLRRDDSVEFQVLLGPGEHVTQSFPCGRYTLKIAEGTEWISDDEAFGPDGDYSTTELFKFEEGQSYRIGAGYGGSIRGDSQGGFTG